MIRIEKNEAMTNWSKLLKNGEKISPVEIMEAQQRKKILEKTVLTKADIKTTDTVTTKVGDKNAPGTKAESIKSETKPETKAETKPEAKTDTKSKEGEANENYEKTIHKYERKLIKVSQICCILEGGAFEKNGEKQPFHVADDEKMLELAASLKLDGQLEPLHILPASVGKKGYEMIAGHCRQHAAILAGLPELEAWLYPANMDRADAKNIVTATNI